MDTATAVATASLTAGSVTIAPAVSTKEVANTSPTASATEAALRLLQLAMRKQQPRLLQ